MKVVREVPSKKEFCEGVLGMLKKEGFSKAVFLGHSLGTMSLSYLLHDPSTRDVISGLIFLDPITFLLHLPDVAYNFLYRQPKRAIEWVFRNIVALEAGIAWSLSRRFFWFDGVIWKNEIDTSILNKNENWRGKTLVILAGKDSIIPSTEVWNYFSADTPKIEYNLDLPKKSKDDLWQKVVKDGVEVVRYPFLEHGAALFKNQPTQILSLKIENMCTGKYDSNSGWISEND